MSTDLKLSLVINTCSLDPLAPAVKYGQRTYRERAQLLADVIIPAAIDEGWHEIIVVGTFQPGDGYMYAPLLPIYRDRRDALWQRELGARLSTGDLIAFSHDDHQFASGTTESLIFDDEPEDTWDLLVPRRVDRAGAELNNGRDAGYMGGHSLIMKRWLWARCPWTAVDTEWWDVSLTRLWREEGGRIVWTDQLQHIDLDTEPVNA